MSWNEDYWLYDALSRCMTVKEIEGNIGRKLTARERRIYDENIEMCQEAMDMGMPIAYCPPSEG